MTQKILTISVDEGEDIVLAVEEILRQLKEGNTSGYSPNWTLEEDTSGYSPK